MRPHIHLSSCSYDGAVKLLGHFEDSTTIYLVQELCAKVSSCRHLAHIACGFRPSHRHRLQSLLKSTHTAFLTVLTRVSYADTADRTGHGILCVIGRCMSVLQP